MVPDPIDGYQLPAVQDFLALYYASPSRYDVRILRLLGSEAFKHISVAPSSTISIFAFTRNPDHIDNARRQKGKDAYTRRFLEAVIS